jgi:hypothetical protein
MSLIFFGEKEQHPPSATVELGTSSAVLFGRSRRRRAVLGAA